MDPQLTVEGHVASAILAHHADAGPDETATEEGRDAEKAGEEARAGAHERTG